MKDLIVSRFLFLAGAKIMHMLPAMPRFVRGAGRVIERQHVDVKRGRNPFVFAAMLLATQVPLATPVAAQEASVDSGMMQRMEALIREQQQQMKRQQQQMAEQQKQMVEQQKQLDYLRQQLGQLKTTTTESLTEAKDAKRVAEAAQATAQAPAKPEEKVVTSGGADRAKLVLKGWINRAVNIVDDGEDTEAYFVDNDNSESRINILGTLNATDDLTIGTEIELTIAPNKASNVNQLDEDKDVNNIFDQRKVQVHFDSKRYGKVSLGKGDTASYHTGDFDLSGTLVIATSTISDTAGGMFFRESGSGKLTDLRILQTYNTWDGLNRQNRLRYDSPSFHGLKVSGSLISDNRHDLALRWGGQGNGFKAVAGAAIADPKVDGDDLNYNGSFSVLHERTGLNFALSAGTRERDNQDNPYNLFGKLGWRTNLFSIGETAFSVDYTRSMNLPTVDDEGYSYGAAVVQNFDGYGTEIYALYRLHSLDRDVEPEVDDINVVSIGTRVKF